VLLTLPCSSFLGAPTLTPDKLRPRKRCCCRNSKPCAIIGPAGLFGTYLTARSKINRDSSFCPNVLGVELNLGIFLLVTASHQNWIAQVIIMEMEGCFVVAAAVGEHRRSNRDSRILDDHFLVRNRTAVHSTDIPLNRESVVHLVHRNCRSGKIRAPPEPSSRKAQRRHETGSLVVPLYPCPMHLGACVTALVLSSLQRSAGFKLARP